MQPGILIDYLCIMMEWQKRPLDLPVPLPPPKFYKPSFDSNNGGIWCAAEADGAKNAVKQCDSGDRSTEKALKASNALFSGGASDNSNEEQSELVVRGERFAPQADEQEENLHGKLIEVPLSGAVSQPDSEKVLEISRESENFPYETASVLADFRTGELTNMESSFRKIPIGPNHQAELPALITRCDKEKEDLDSSLCWLGIHVWPPEGFDTIGGSDESRGNNGRPANCLCPLRDSVECVRLHIQEKRQFLRNQLGETAFELLGFDKSGESVSEAWTREEELYFWNLVASRKNFWDFLCVAFPSKTMKEFVSYYFNVFILRRRAIQNRLCPDNIDSDDDKTELLETDDEDDEVVEMDEEEDEEEEDDDDEEDEFDNSEGDEFGYEGGQTTSIVYNNQSQNSGEEEGNHSSVEKQDQGREEVDISSASVAKLSTAKEIVGKDTDVCEFTGVQHKETSPLSNWLENSSSREVHEDPNYVFSLKNAAVDTEPSNCHFLDQCESKMWDSHMGISSGKDVDKLIPTNRMMKEFFGEEVLQS